MAYEGLGLEEPQQQYSKFDLTTALKQPWRVAQRKPLVPVEWHYFEKGNTIGYTNTLNLLTTVNENGFLYGYGIISDYDLVLLPESKPFELKEGKWYWVKFIGQIDPLRALFSNDEFWINNDICEFSAIESVHPTPIEAPSDGFIKIKYRLNEP